MGTTYIKKELELAEVSSSVEKDDIFRADGGTGPITILDPFSSLAIQSSPEGIFCNGERNVDQLQRFFDTM